MGCSFPHFTPLFWLSVLIFVAVGSVSIKKGRVLELLPASLWLTLQLWPLLVFRNTFDPQVVELQTKWSLAIFSVLLSFPLLQEIIETKKQKSRALGVAMLSQPESLFLTIALFLTITLQCIHLASMPSIPLLEWLMDQTLGTPELRSMREKASKLLDFPRPLVYLMQSALFVIAPLCICSLWRRRRYFSSTLLFSWTTLYSLSWLTKTPFSHVFLAIVFVSIGTAAGKYRVLLGTLLAILPPAIFLGATLYLNHSSQSFIRIAQAKFVEGAPYKINIEGGGGYGCADLLRIMDEEGDLPAYDKVHKTINYFIYRTILTPVDVSYRWYAYFPKVPGEFAGWYKKYSLTAHDWITHHPARQVGQWAYSTKFPNKYPATNMTNGSFDADAYGRAGNYGIVVAITVLVGVWIALCVLRTGTEISEMTYLIALSLLAALLPQGSFQGLLIAKGLLFSLGILALARIFRLTSPMEN